MQGWKIAIKYTTQDYGNIKVVMEVSNPCLQKIFAWEVFKYFGTIQMGSEMAISLHKGWVGQKKSKNLLM